jgi:hypothetical protein
LADFGESADTIEKLTGPIETELSEIPQFVAPLSEVTMKSLRHPKRESFPEERAMHEMVPMRRIRIIRDVSGRIRIIEE